MAKSKTSGDGRGGCVWFILLCLLVGTGAGWIFSQARPKPPIPTSVAVPLPAPVEIAAPMPPPLPVPTSTPTPPPTPEPVTKATPTPEPRPALTALSGRQLPLQVKLVKPTTFTLTSKGRPAGIATVPAGVMLRLERVRSEELIDVQYQQAVQSIPADSTDIFDRVRSLGQYVVAPTPAPAVVKFTGFASPTPARTARKAEPLRPGSLLQEDFDSGNIWPGIASEAVGTIDEAGSKEPSLGLRANATISSGPLAVKSGGADLEKLTLAFSLSASAALPVHVRIESYDAGKSRTGGLETVIYPAAPDFHQRYALDLASFKPSGIGTFAPNASFVSFTFSIASTDWKGVEKPEIRVDNLHYAKPAFYVSAEGSDNDDGRSDKQPFATIQKALDESGPGDIIVLMNGSYSATPGQQSVAAFKQSGAPAAWISLKNHPGHKPVITPIGVWSGVMIRNDVSELGWLEVRGLHIRGDADEAKTKYADAIGQVDPHTNGNGISTDGSKGTLPPHHLRFADNLVEYCAGAGIGTGESDWVTVEYNIVRNNCWWMIYAGSGISLLGVANFDAVDNTYRDLIRNNIVSGNRCFVEWKKIGKISDGNGIIIDTNHLPDEDKSHLGRTLIQNNLVFNNGGSGIHAFKSHRVDIINNTAYLNGASPELRWGQIFFQRTDDGRMINNILWARNDQPVNTVGKGGDDKANTNIERSHNLYFNGENPIMGRSDRVRDPNFVNPSVDPAVAVFRLKPGSPARNAGTLEPFGPSLDIEGNRRADKPDLGAYEMGSIGPGAVQ